MAPGHKIIAVWCLLIAVTLLSWRLGTGHGIAVEGAHTLASVVIIVIAGIKIRLVGLWFMELREAATPLRLAFEAYVFGVCAMMVWLYL